MRKFAFIIIEIDADDNKRQAHQTTPDISHFNQVFEETKKFFSQTPKIAVIGRPNAGKSTLLNSLLFQSVLPVDHAECTAVSIEV